jgi:serine/threonine-protein kinase
MSQTQDSPVGTTVAGYRIEALIGKGGMGVVYRAFDPRLERRVALKLLPAERALDGRFRARFARESRQAAAIEHPCIVPVHDAGDADGMLYIAMRYVEGTDLGQVIRQDGPLDPERVLRLLADIADALDAAHARGLVHRDVKPSNILVETTNAAEHAYLTDFGASRQARGSDTLTVTGQFLGTANYAAPEQIADGTASSRSDVYSLGAVLFESLTGQPPFVRETPVAVLWAHVNEPVPSPSALRPVLPAEIDAVLARALAKNADERYPTCAAIVEAARTAFGLSQPTGAATPTSPVPRALEQHCEAVLAEMLRGRVVVVLGSSASLGTSESSSAFSPTPLPPVEDDVAARLAERFGYPLDGVLELPRVSQYAEVMQGAGPLRDELHDMFSAEYQPVAVHELLARLPELLRSRGAPHQLIVTTGFDDALERAFAAAGEQLDVVGYVADGRDRGRFWHRNPDGEVRLIELPRTYVDELALERRTIALRLQGQVDRSGERDRESFVVTEDDYIELLGDEEPDGAIPVVLKAQLRRSHFLLIGMDVKAWSTRALLRRLWDARQVSYRSWAVAPTPSRVEREFWRDRDVELVDAPLDQYVATFGRVVGRAAERMS